MELFFSHLFTVEIVVAIPLAVEWIFCVANIVAEAERAIVIDNAVQVVIQVNLQLLFHVVCV